jgi:hypothetical protein
MKPPEFITLAGVAQPSAMPVIGFMGPAPAATYLSRVEALSADNPALRHGQRLSNRMATIASGPKPLRQLSLATVITFIAVFAIAPVCAFENLPDKNLTGGSVRTGDRDAACGDAKESRGRMNVVRRDEILRRYGLPPDTHPDYQIDHLIPLCLGGSDDPSNLWPQPRRSIEDTWNAEAKDRLERLMCRMVCDGQIDIAAAQQAFATDWIAAYHAYYEGRTKQ